MEIKVNLMVRYFKNNYFIHKFNSFKNDIEKACKLSLIYLVMKIIYEIIKVIDENN